MRNTSLLLFLTPLFFAGCSGSSDSDTAALRDSLSALRSTCDSALTLSEAQAITIVTLRDSIEQLLFPAPDRLAKAEELLKQGLLSQAESELNELQRIFPKTPQAAEVPALRQRIADERQRQRLEKERIAALGFKALPQKTTITVGYNTITLSAISTGKEFRFDSYDYSWYYRTAERGNKFITMAMTVKSSSKDPKIPQFAVYAINGSEMRLVKTFDTRYARWSDFGAYLGNYSDDRNDFAKVSSVSFKLGAEVADSVLSAPHAIVMFNANVLTGAYDSLRNPPRYWTGEAPFAPILILDSFNSKYVLIKTFNLK